MRFRSHFLLYLVLAVTDAWLLSHPNLIGRIGIWLYKYAYIKTFSRALVFVLILVGLSILVSELVKKYLPIRTGVLVLALMLVIASMAFMNVFIQFSSGTYQFTGKGFIWGAHLLPIILILIFAQSLYELFRTGKLDSK
ncbi:MULTISPECIES: hypothetical protein [unclassified Siphonobacter]|uniref:hypothetical protein n=1 Tax=unclassified Siphonobacter TaxID=2635712 RepID=UPI000CADE52F|nr:MULTISPECIES: hypothetical protein [unclassified Siphonobacter]MDQ1086037.1 hypothetical protein [Siphonobacter sp. SORGH_AS_1065]MDR6196361.1 hypothetical protein [Siphonobacter sp. SORGH_AS_0500]PKK38032.1 hypothetical protein BWI96_02825 [Siphonobacter sp. SORGH_AS_0500]